jgi:hypothetical protein
MGLVSMNVKDDDDGGCCACSPSDYDPSPCVYLTGAQVAALGLTASPGAGTTVKITAVAIVQSVTESAYDGDEKEISLSLKITDMELGSAGSGGASLY